MNSPLLRFSVLQPSTSQLLYIRHRLVSDTILQNHHFNLYIGVLPALRGRKTQR